MIGAYILSLIYVIYEPAVSKNRKRKKIAEALILYWQEQLEKQGQTQPSKKEEELVYEMLLERLKIWAWFEPELWNKYFPDENYSKYLFGMVDNFIVYWQQQKNKYEKK